MRFRDLVFLLYGLAIGTIIVMVSQQKSCNKKISAIESTIDHYSNMSISEESFETWTEDEGWDGFIGQSVDSAFSFNFDSILNRDITVSEYKEVISLNNQSITHQPLLSLPNVEKILKRKLKIDEVIIKEEKHSRAKFGLATCDSNGPVIYFTESFNSYTAPLSYVFFREHEFAHHVLGHISCDRKDQKSLKKERDADCEAVRRLLEFGDAGKRVVDVAAGIFIGLNKTSKNHGNSFERAMNLFACQDINE